MNESTQSEPSRTEKQFIRSAHHFLERDSVLIRMANAVGKPAHIFEKALPRAAQTVISKAVEKALAGALKTSLMTLHRKGEVHAASLSLNKSLGGSRWDRLLHGGMALSSGAVGGFFGLPGMFLELPVTTTIMMRNIVAIAGQFGFSKDDPSTAVECLYIFSLGSNGKSDDGFESAYYTSRAAMSSVLRHSAQYIASSTSRALIDSLRKGSAPIVINLVARIAAHFEIVVTEKILASAVPVIGSVGAAAVNLAFTDYFGQAAQYHFGLLSLEKKYGQETVRKIYSENI